MPNAKGLVAISSKLRPEQLSLYEFVVGCLRQRGTVAIVEAPPGFGKTRVISWACSKLAADMGWKAFIAVRTHKQGEKVLQDIRELEHEQLRAAILLGRSKACPIFHSSREENPYLVSAMCRVLLRGRFCPFFKNLCLKYEEVLLSMISPANNVEELKRQAIERGSCPYYLSWFLAFRSDVIILTHQHLVDFTALNLVRKLEPHIINSLLFIDEAHNLIDEIFTSATKELRQENLTVLLDEFIAANAPRPLCVKLYNLVKDLIHLINSLPSNQLIPLSKVRYVNPSFFDVTLYTQLLKLYYSLVASGAAPDQGIAALASLVDAISAASRNEKDYALYAYRDDEGRGVLLVPTNLRKRAASIFSAFRASVLTSATFSPLEVYLRPLGLEGARVEKRRVSIEAMDFHLKVLIVDSVTTLFSERSQTLFDAIAALVALVADTVRKVVVFFPSYSVLKAVAFALEDYKTSYIILNGNCKAKPLDSEANCYLAVIGGRFSEGVEIIPEVRVVLIAGLPVPPPTPKTEAKRQILEVAQRGAGYVIAYALPAARRVVQAVGRILRKPGSRGVAILADERFKKKRYLGLLPNWLVSNAEVISDLKSLRRILLSLQPEFTGHQRDV